MWTYPTQWGRVAGQMYLSSVTPADVGSCPQHVGAGVVPSLYDAAHSVTLDRDSGGQWDLEDVVWMYSTPSTVRSLPLLTH